eukprot:6419550-Pyramimonas_sp.AAC.1
MQAAEEEENEEEEEDQCKPNNHQRCWNPEACQNIILGNLTPRINLTVASGRPRIIPKRYS